MPESLDLLFASRRRVPARAVLIGERIDLRALESGQRLAKNPLVISAGDHACAVLFRYGVVVLVGLNAVEEASFLAHLKSLVHQAATEPESEEFEIALSAEQSEGVENGVVTVDEPTVERIQVIADIMAKSVVLSNYESKVTKVFERIEPLAAGLQEKGHGKTESRELLRHIGGALLIQQRTVGRVETAEKPELLWEHPELERLYLRLADEYELSERQVSLEAKLTVISRTAETLLELLQNRQTLRVEWYIVILIVVEILLTLYQMFVHP